MLLKGKEQYREFVNKVGKTILVQFVGIVGLENLLS